LRATQGAVLYLGYWTATFASTPPANTFSGNTAVGPPHLVGKLNPNVYGNCFLSEGATIAGSCGASCAPIAACAP
jgi:hypothetical protein